MSPAEGAVVGLQRKVVARLPRSIQTVPAREVPAVGVIERACVAVVLVSAAKDRGAICRAAL